MGEDGAGGAEAGVEVVGLEAGGEGDEGAREEGAELVVGGVPVVESAAVELGEEGAVEVAPAVDGHSGKAELPGDGGVWEAVEDHLEGELLAVGEFEGVGFIRQRCNPRILNCELRLIRSGGEGGVRFERRFGGVTFGKRVV